MENIVIENFEIKLNKEKILNTLGCRRESSIYDTVSGYFNLIEEGIYNSISPYAAAREEGGKMYCLLTLGGGVSGYIKSLFDAGEGMKGMLADAAADEYLFEMDSVLSERIKLECAPLGLGVKKRLAAPGDFPLSVQNLIIEKAGRADVGITDAFMFEPVKTFGYILELTDDKNVFNAQHDCRKCSNLSCPRRGGLDGAFEALSDYEYKPKLKKGERAVCIDIGTTTVVFELITDKGTVNAKKILNPQRRFGLDVLSRIEAANRGRLSELSALIRYAVADGFRDVTGGVGADKVIIAGNTTMIHLLMGYSCAALGEYPFKQVRTETIKTTFDAVTGSCAAPVETVIIGGISAFVGGDIVSGLYMCDFDKSDKVNLFIDLGTNGEMAAGNRDRIIATSAAAGPAFEGGRISCGSGSVDGAICGIDIKKGEIRTIGNKKPVGICGTGIIELVSELVGNGIADRTGLLKGDFFESGYKTADGIVFTQNDMRQVQMAKAAIRAGIEILLSEYGAEYGDVDTVYLAGGFGRGLSSKKACNIGILPKELESKTKSVGNSSLGGCAKYCSLAGADKRIEHIKSISKEICLGNTEEFNEMYIKYMNF